MQHARICVTLPGAAVSQRLDVGAELGQRPAGPELRHLRLVLVEELLEHRLKQRLLAREVIEHATFRHARGRCHPVDGQVACPGARDDGCRCIEEPGAAVRLSFHQQSISLYRLDGIVRLSQHVPERYWGCLG